MPGQSIKIRDCPGQSGTYSMYAKQPRLLTTLRKKAFENIMGKENAVNQHCLHFSLIFSSFEAHILCFDSTKFVVGNFFQSEQV